MSSNADYSNMKEAQSFFQTAVKICLEGTVDDLSKTMTSFATGHPNLSFKDIVEEFHTEGRTLLHIASSAGKLEIVRYIIENCSGSKDFVNKRDKKGNTPLILSTISESEETMKYLLSKGANVNDVNEDGAGSVHFAASDGSISRLLLLRSAGADLSLSSSSGNPLQWAAGKGRFDMVKCLIDCGIDVNNHNENSAPPVIIAAAAHDEASVCLLLDNNAKYDQILSGNLTLLHLCAENGLIEAVRKIITSEIGLKLNEIATVDGNYPIHLAAMSKHKDIVELLIHISQSVIDGLSVDELISDGEIRLAKWHETHSKVETPLEIEKGNSKSSNDTFDESIVDTRLSEEYKVKGNDYFKGKKFEDAVTAYTKAIECNPSSAVLWSNRSACFMELKQYNKALQDAETCRKLDPSWAKGCYRLAVARLALNMYEDAAVAAFEGCKIDDSNLELKKLLKEAVRLGQEEYKRNHS